MKILFVGNSYTYVNDMPKMLEALLIENGRDAQVFSVTAGGRRLIQSTSDDEKAKALRSLLDDHTFDAAILQEQSLLPILDKATFLRGAEGVKELMGDRVERIILYSTWGRKPGSPDLAEHGWTHEGMTADLVSAYEEAAKLIGADLSYVGKAFSRAMQINPSTELYHADMTHPSYLGSALGVVVHFAALTGDMPEKLGSLKLGKEDEELITEAAAYSRK